ncbi:GRAM domain-containing protein [Subsaxibacter sp. CAU 1640]|uniref:GRAM domain-containing protein n=1 Tax=Subsaxibacter sp. CAU 1640 TaxID=2933271 RepID=UPI00200337BB|nr:GRAM domain-containing protein [Subsaxibacter sp. CAU 1640]MCK7590815.1 GRAM domain-containing protein [Subsaxibacter sp. CAU 1640]
MKWQYRLIFAVCAGVFYGLILWLMNYSTDGEMYSTNGILFQAVFFGLFFGIGFPYLNEKLGGKVFRTLGQNITPDLDDDEKVEVEGPANLFRGIEGVGGKLFLTNTHLIFKSHKFNVQGGQTAISYQDIADVQKRKTAKFIDNGLRIVTKNDKQYDLVVNERSVWYDQLKERLSS